MPQFRQFLHKVIQHISYHIIRITETAVVLFHPGIHKAGAKSIIGWN